MYEYIYNEEFHDSLSSIQKFLNTCNIQVIIILSLWFCIHKAIFDQNILNLIYHILTALALLYS